MTLLCEHTFLLLKTMWHYLRPVSTLTEDAELGRCVLLRCMITQPSRTALRRPGLSWRLLQTRQTRAGQAEARLYKAGRCQLCALLLHCSCPFRGAAGDIFIPRKFSISGADQVSLIHQQRQQRWWLTTQVFPDMLWALQGTGAHAEISINDLHA